MRNLKYALKTKSNPLKLTKKERKSLTAKMKSLSVRNAVNAMKNHLLHIQNQFVGQTKIKLNQMRY